MEQQVMDNDLNPFLVKRGYIEEFVLCENILKAKLLDVEKAQIKPDNYLPLSDDDAEEEEDDYSSSSDDGYSNIVSNM